MALFILYGGEIVFAIIGARIALWLLRSGLHRERAPRGPGPRPGGGVPVPNPPIDLAALGGPASRRAAPAGLRKAA